MNITILSTLLLAILTVANTWASAIDTVDIYAPYQPMVIGNEDNVLVYLRVNAEGGELLDNVTLTLGNDTDPAQIKHLTLYYSGVEAHHKVSPNTFRPTRYFYDSGKAMKSLSVLLDRKAPSPTITLDAKQTLSKGVNYLWVSLTLADDASLTARIVAQVSALSIDGKEVAIADFSQFHMPLRTAVAVRRAGDDKVAAYRIPGLITTKHGTLLAVYDIRYNNSIDLQQKIDIGLSRSTDGGRTWEKMRIPMTFAGVGGMPDAQNGVGDPCVLYDPYEDKVWIAALWCHGMGNQMAWVGSQPGLEIGETGQLVLTHSNDDGCTWSQPTNITRMVKDPSWHLLLQGPGRGITMSDGTLVFPIQYITSPDRIPEAGIMYSRDKGETWEITSGARTNTTESQVAELPDGTLMLNMRDNRKGSRAVATTTDLGVTWSEHPSSRSALREPVCMASLISVPASQNNTGRDLLLFSNPDSETARNKITIKVSTDNGLSWPVEHQVMLDEGTGWGYSCLTMVDKDHVAILYESSVANMTYQVIPLSDLISK